MNLYLISQDKNNDWDTYDSAVVVAPSEEVARRICPSYDIKEDIPKNNILPLDETDFRYLNPDWLGPDDDFYFSDWVLNVNDVTVKFIGTTELYDKPQVICASYNAG